MRCRLGVLLLSLVLLRPGMAQDGALLSRYSKVIADTLGRDYKEMLREKGGSFAYPFLTPGSKSYADVLWDWDSWLSDVALRQVLQERATAEERKATVPYERGCILNYLNYGGMDGWVPILISRNTPERPKLMKLQDTYATNMHKPCLAQHAAFLVQQDGNDAEWLRERFEQLQEFVNRYRNHQRHKATGLYYWNDDAAIGVDNDPSTFMRPPKSSGSIYLNCLMYKELLAMVFLADKLNLGEIAREYQADADELKQNIQKHCWDERDGFFYSVDLNLTPPGDRTIVLGGDVLPLHVGYPRDYDCLIQRIDVWSGFLAMWSGVATPEQARRMVQEHLRNPKTFDAAYGVRTLSKLEKMYNVRASGNPSLWTGPIWGVSNYLVFRGLVKYGFQQDAKLLAEKTIRLFGSDLEKSGALHEYYLPDNGEPVLNKGFQNWNYLVLNMMAWRDGRKAIEEF